jgi:hypothetical protein
VLRNNSGTERDRSTRTRLTIRSREEDGLVRERVRLTRDSIVFPGFVTSLVSSVSATSLAPKVAILGNKSAKTAVRSPTAAPDDNFLRSGNRVRFTCVITIACPSSNRIQPAHREANRDDRFAQSLQAPSTGSSSNARPKSTVNGNTLLTRDRKPGCRGVSARFWVVRTCFLGAACLLHRRPDRRGASLFRPPFTKGGSRGVPAPLERCSP